MYPSRLFTMLVFLVNISLILVACGGSLASQISTVTPPAAAATPPQQQKAIKVTVVYDASSASGLPCLLEFNGGP